MRTKTVDTSDWDFGAPAVQAVKLASFGLRGGDRTLFVKRAGDSAALFLPQIDAGLFKSGEVPVHALALGAYENFGANRNSDCFSGRYCRECHPSFVKKALFFRDHKNDKDRDPHYGVIKASAFNEDMGRVELLIGLFGTKEAAERHGPLARVADKELQLLDAKTDVPVSMSCKIAFDRCLMCGNEAKHRADYCTADTCPGGGCKENLGKVVKVGGDLRRVIVDNPYPEWFDLSHVDRQADWTAYAATPDWLAKAAGAKPVAEPSKTFSTAAPATGWGTAWRPRTSVLKKRY